MRLTRFIFVIFSFTFFGCIESPNTDITGKQSNPLLVVQTLLWDNPLTWNDDEGVNPGDISYFTIYYETGDNNYKVLTDNITVNYFIFRGAHKDIKYTYKVTVTGRHGVESDYSNEASTQVSTKPVTDSDSEMRLNPPRNLTVH